MRTTRTRVTDYAKMLKFVKGKSGQKTIDIIERFARLYKIVDHRAAKVFWELAENKYQSSRWRYTTSAPCGKAHGKDQYPLA